MEIRFDPDFDGGAWPGPLHDREAVAGEAWLGELGLLGPWIRGASHRLLGGGLLGQP